MTFKGMLLYWLDRFLCRRCWRYRYSSDGSYSCWTSHYVACTEEVFEYFHVPFKRRKPREVHAGTDIEL